MATASYMPFNPNGPRDFIAAAGTAPTAKQFPVYSDQTAYGEFLITTTAATFVTIGYGNTAAKAQANATAGTANSFTVLGNSMGVYRLPPNAFISAVSASTNNTYITPGCGQV